MIKVQKKDIGAVVTSLDVCQIKTASALRLRLFCCDKVDFLHANAPDGAFFSAFTTLDWNRRK
jgi:hypothetical protein